jgi:hypothetical protein
MAALTEHISDHVTNLIDSRFGSAHAHHIEPFTEQPPQQQLTLQAAPTTPSVFDRMASNTTVTQARQAKKQKKDAFLSNLSAANNQ